MEYFKSFIIGSSAPVFILYFIYLSYNKEIYTLPYYLYSIIVPIYFGLVTTLGIYFGNKYSLTLRGKLFISSIISIIIVMLLAYFYARRYYRPYKNFNNQDWLIYFIGNGLLHFIIYNFVIYSIMIYIFKIKN